MPLRGSELGVDEHASTLLSMQTVRRLALDPTVDSVQAWTGRGLVRAAIPRWVASLIRKDVRVEVSAVLYYESGRLDAPSPRAIRLRDGL